MAAVTVGIDLAKSVFQVHGVDADGQADIASPVVARPAAGFFADLPPCRIGMEACASAHHWARQLVRLGHDVRLIPPQYAKPYVKRNKTDAADAEAICEAVARPNMRFVPIKTVDQQAVLALHRARSLLVRQRTQLANAIRGLLGEFGIVAPKGIRRLSELRERAAGTEEDASPTRPALRWVAVPTARRDPGSDWCGRSRHPGLACTERGEPATGNRARDRSDHGDRARSRGR